MGSHNSGGVVQEDHLTVLFTPVNADVHLNGGLDAGELLRCFRTCAIGRRDLRANVVSAGTTGFAVDAAAARWR